MVTVQGVGAYPISPKAHCSGRRKSGRLHSDQRHSA